MQNSWIDTIWHKKLGRPYHLAKVIDEGTGIPVVLMHGIGRTGKGWRHVVAGLRKHNQRAVAYDVLGFGASPKPHWIEYSADDHAKALIASIAKLKLRQPVVLVGHSMGCLIAVRAATLRPDLIKHLVLYEMPIYDGLPKSWRYRFRTDLYFKVYQKLIDYTPMSSDKQTATDRMVTKLLDAPITTQNWLPYSRSLKNTIIKQNAVAEIKQLTMPIDIIYGTYDILVFRGKKQHIYGEAPLVTSHNVKARHNIAEKPSIFIVERIMAALDKK